MPGAKGTFAGRNVISAPIASSPKSPMGPIVALYVTFPLRRIATDWLNDRSTGA